MCTKFLFRFVLKPNERENIYCAACLKSEAAETGMELIKEHKCFIIHFLSCLVLSSPDARRQHTNQFQFVQTT